MAGDVEPRELALLVDFAERPRLDDWSLRSAVVRYAQPQPVRASRVLDCVRRTEGALHAHGRLLQSDGHELWNALQSDGAASDAAHGDVVRLLEVAATLDRLGDLLASWAARWPAPRPDDEIDAVTAEVEARLNRLGVAADGPPPGGRFGRATRPRRADA